MSVDDICLLLEDHMIDGYSHDRALECRCGESFRGSHVNDQHTLHVAACLHEAIR